MLKDLLFMWCVMMAVSSYNTQFVEYPHHDSLSDARFPLLDPVEQLALKSVDRKALLSKLKNRLKEKNKNAAAPVASSSLAGDKQFGGGGGGFLSQLIQQVIEAFVNYVESVLASRYPELFSTKTKTITRTSFFTCTKSTTACAGRRRRAALMDLLDDPLESERKDLSLASSILMKNNGSPETPDLDSIFSDYFDSLPDDDLPYYDPVLLEGSIEMDPSTDRIPTRKQLKMKIAKNKEFRSQLMNIRQLPPSEAAQLVRQFGFNTVTTTVTAIKTRTVTSYPACSSQGNLVQCTRKGND